MVCILPEATRSSKCCGASVETVVSVTARTLRDILPVLVSQIVEALASGHPEQTQVAGRCLGDNVIHAH